MQGIAAPVQKGPSSWSAAPGCAISGSWNRCAPRILIRGLLYHVLKRCYNLFLPWIEGERQCLGDVGEPLYSELEALVRR